MSSSINHRRQPFHDGGGSAWIHPHSLDYYHRLHQYYSMLPPATTTTTTPSSDHLILRQQQHYPSTSPPPLTYYFGDRLRIPPPSMFDSWIDKWSHQFTGFLEHDDDSFLVPWRFGDNASGGGGGGSEGKVVVFDGASLFSYDITDKEAFAKSFSRTNICQEPSHDTRDGCNLSKSEEDVKESKVQRDECKETCNFFARTPQIEIEEVKKPTTVMQ